MFEPRSERWTESLVRKMPQAEGIACVEAWNGSELWNVEVMLKTWPLCAGAKLNFGDRVLGEAEKSSFIAMPGKGGYSWLLPLKIACPNPGGFGEELYSNTSMVRMLIRLGSCRACSPLIWSQVISWWSFSGSFNLVSGMKTLASFSWMKNADIFYLLGILVL